MQDLSRSFDAYWNNDRAYPVQSLVTRLDLRSQLQNTEIALLIRSDELSQIATDKIESVLREGAWHVERRDGQLVWRAPQGSGLAVATSEPDTSASLRLMLKMFGPLAPDELL